MNQRKVYKTAFLSFGIAISLTMQAQHDEFSISHSYLTGNVTGTPWAGVLNSGILTTGDANTTNAGKLTISSANGNWENSGNSGPFLYNLISGDFIADLEVSSATTPCCNDVGILARPANLADAGAGEDNILIRYFAPANLNSIRSTDNSFSSNTNQPQFYRFLRLARTGNVFSCFYKALSTDSWTQMTGSPFTRSDFAGLPLQVGIAQATFNPTNGTGVFESISITPGLLTSGINFSSVTSGSANISWTSGNGTQRAVFLKQTATGSAVPVNGATYTASAVFGSGTQIGSTGWYCVYNGTGNSVTVTGLSANTNYGVMIVEYFGTAGFEAYNSLSNSGNTGYFLTAVCPTVIGSITSSTNVSCNGGNDGAASVSASGGTAFTYSWSPSGGTASTATGLSAGTYSCTITNECSGSVIVTVTITEPTALTSTSSATSILCNGGSSTVTVSGSGGVSPYTGEGTFTVTAGTFSYTVTDANGCISTTSVTITEPTAISTVVASTNVLCNGDSTGSIDLTVTGGTAPYTFNWNSGAFTTEDLTNIPAGSYSGVLTDANGCTDGGTVVINEPAVLAATAVVTNPTGCTTNDGAIDLSVAGGTPGYAYVWSTTATTEDVTALDGGNYTITVTDTNGCSVVESFTLTEPLPPTVTFSAGLDTVCQSTTTPFTLTGASPAGGVFTGTGMINDTVFDPMTASIGFNVITYTFTDSLGCTGTAVDSILVDVCTDIASQISGLTSQVSIFPNPNNGAFTVITSTFADMMIYDAQGKLVAAQKVQANVQKQINIENSGMYLITIVAADGSRNMQRVVVTK